MKCHNCGGVGETGSLSEHASRRMCPVCKGAGTVTICSRCNGSSRLSNIYCSGCDGYGYRPPTFIDKVLVAVGTAWYGLLFASIAIAAGSYFLHTPEYVVPFILFAVTLIVLGRHDLKLKRILWCIIGFGVIAVVDRLWTLLIPVGFVWPVKHNILVGGAVMLATVYYMFPLRETDPDRFRRLRFPAIVLMPLAVLTPIVLWWAPFITAGMANSRQRTAIISLPYSNSPDDINHRLITRMPQGSATTKAAKIAYLKTAIHELNVRLLQDQAKFKASRQGKVSNTSEFDLAVKKMKEGIERDVQLARRNAAHGEGDVVAVEAKYILLRDNLSQFEDLLNKGIIPSDWKNDDKIQW